MKCSTNLARCAAILMLGFLLAPGGVVAEQPSAKQSRAKQADAAGKPRVLLIGRNAGFHWRFLKDLLARGGFETKLVLRAADSDENPTELPANGKELGDFDVVIVDGSFRRRGPGEGRLMRAIGEAVRDGGVGLIVVSGANADFDDELLEMLPVAFDRRTTSDAPSQARWLRLTSEGLKTPVMLLGLKADAARQVWNGEAARVFATANVGQAKVGASVWATVRPDGEDGRSLPAVAAQVYGKGRVLLVGTDELWRLRRAEAGNLFDSFWKLAIEHVDGR